MGAVKYIVGIVAAGFAAVLCFYPLDFLLPEVYWPFVPDLLLHYPLMFILNQLIPAILWGSFFVLGALLIRGAVKS